MNAHEENKRVCVQVSWPPTTTDSKNILTCLFICAVSQFGESFKIFKQILFVITDQEDEHEPV